ncbi:MAG TPA: STAS domain-containing protein [Bryobacteraceae bacterium]|nr:STAS domain-containing protein [Bryobacteraceae bacterium]
MTPIASLPHNRYFLASKNVIDSLSSSIASLLKLNRSHMLQREKEGIQILDLKGNLSVGKSEVALRDAIATLAQSGNPKVIINLEYVSKIDSAGLTALLVSQAKIRRAGGALKLLHLKAAHRDLLAITAMETAFDSFEDEQDAINSFFPDRAIKHYDILEFVANQQEPLASMK